MSGDAEVFNGYREPTERSVRAAGGGFDPNTYKAPEKVLAKLKIWTLFWGKFWARPPGPGQEVFDALRKLAGSDYFDSLSQYGVVQHAMFGSHIFDDYEPGGLKIDDKVVANLLSESFTKGYLKAPDTAEDQLYFVFLPPGSVHSGSYHEDKDKDKAKDYYVLGAHGAFPFKGNPQHPCYFAWANYPGGSAPVAWGDGARDALTRVASHEIVEAATDPDVGSGVTLQSPPGFNGCPEAFPCPVEIGDSLEDEKTKVNGVAVQRYWSQRDRKPVPT